MTDQTVMSHSNRDAHALQSERVLSTVEKATGASVEMASCHTCATSKDRWALDASRGVEVISIERSTSVCGAWDNTFDHASEQRASLHHHNHRTDHSTTVILRSNGLCVFEGSRLKPSTL